MRNIDLIVLHCSDSDFGDAALIDRWHRERGFGEIGYHLVILNAYPKAECLRLRRPQFDRDGVVQTGRPIEKPGAHIEGLNNNSLGICLIGREIFTQMQFSSLSRMIYDLRKRFPQALLRGHYEAQLPGAPAKSCPNLDMEWLRDRLGVEYKM